MKKFTFTLYINDEPSYTQVISADSAEQAEKYWKLALFLLRKQIKKAKKDGIEISYTYEENK